MSPREWKPSTTISPIRPNKLRECRSTTSASYFRTSPDPWPGAGKYLVLKLHPEEALSQLLPGSVLIRGLDPHGVAAGCKVSRVQRDLDHLLRRQERKWNCKPDVPILLHYLCLIG